MHLISALLLFKITIRENLIKNVVIFFYPATKPTFSVEPFRWVFLAESLRCTIRPIPVCVRLVIPLLLDSPQPEQNDMRTILNSRQPLCQKGGPNLASEPGPSSILQCYKRHAQSEGLR